MHSTSTETRAISKRLKLSKTVREQYTHQGLSFFPSHHKFDKTVLILSRPVLEEYGTILHTGFYDYVVLSSIVQALPHSVQKSIKSTNAIVFGDDSCTETIGQGVEGVLAYCKSAHPSARFDILYEHNLREHLEAHPEAMDIIYSKENGCADANADGQYFRDHLESLEYYHKTGRISRGTLVVSSVNNQEGEVLGNNERTRVAGRSLNRAMHGDEVYVEGSEIVGISKRKLRTVVGTLYRIEETGRPYATGFVRPIDRRLPEMVVATGLRNCLKRKVVADVVEWDARSPHPRAVIFKILGENGSMEDEVQAVLEHFDIKYFEGGWLGALNRRRAEKGISNGEGGRKIDGTGKCDESPEGLGFESSEFTIETAYEEVREGKRKDLRHLSVCSIDPQGCTDIDDALHCQEHGDYIEVGVHIADVSLYVKEDSVLDAEAKHRSTTVYFPDRRIDMLPGFLSAGLCSLLEGQDRATVSCIWRMDREFNVLGTEICRSVVRSRKAFSYEEAYGALAEDASLALLMKVATKLRNDRFERGALELNTQEIYVDSERNIKMKESVPTHYLVEEFMLLANISVAEFIFRHNPEYSVLRKHPLPSAIELDQIDCSSSKTINASLSAIDPENATIMKRIITRSMQQALYFVSGETSDFYHYGLATEIYTHFTSPIRRYPDILVHRTLARILEDDEEAIDRLAAVVTTRACSFMNYRHRNAQNASRMVNELYLYATMEDKALDAVVVSLRADGCIVFIREYGIEEFLRTDKKYGVFERLRVGIKRDFQEFCITRKMELYEA